LNWELSNQIKEKHTELRSLCTGTQMLKISCFHAHTLTLSFNSRELHALVF